MSKFMIESEYHIQEDIGYESETFCYPAPICDTVRNIQDYYAFIGIQSTERRRFYVRGTKFLYSGSDHGMMLIAPGTDPNPLVLIQDFLQETLGGSIN